MLGQDAILKPDDVYRDESRRTAIARKAAVNHDEVTFGHDDAAFIDQCVRQGS